MENRRFLITALIILLFIPLQVTAYSNNNIGGHPSINEFAVLYFDQNIRPADPLLKDTSIRGEASWGWAWDETDRHRGYRSKEYGKQSSQQTASPMD